MKKLPNIQKRKKQKRKERRDEQTGIFLNETDPDLIPGERRGATRKILKNKGLMPSRRKDIKNPRTKQREKFRKATAKRHSQVQEFTGKKGVYEGEKTGIKKTLTKSRKLK